MARFDELTVDGRKEFLRINNIDFEPVSSLQDKNYNSSFMTKIICLQIPKEEKKAKLARLLNTFQFMNATQFDVIDFYKVPFRRVLDLVKNRKVLLEKGQAYVSSNELGNLIASKLRQEISHSLAVSVTRLLQGGRII